MLDSSAFQSSWPSIDSSESIDQNIAWSPRELSNRSDTQAEIDLVKRIAMANGAFDAVMADHWAKGRGRRLD